MASPVDDLTDMVGSTLGRFAREATHAVSQNGRGSSFPLGKKDGGGGSSAVRGVVAGAALAAAAPLVGKAAKGAVLKRVGDVKSNVTDAVGKKVDQATDVPEVAKEAGKKMIPGVGGGDGGGGGSKKGTPGVGKGRRMPVQQAFDIAVPLEVAYNQWTQFEEWSQFMHRLTQITQEDDCTVSFKTKVWGMSKEFVAEIVEQRPDERIQWNVKQGVTHTGVVTFHELAPRLTRVQVSLDVDPGSLIEKAARGMRHIKRAVRADMARFKAFIEMQEVETGAWRGVIHDGEVVEEHPSDYDSDREYADVDDIQDSEHSHEPREAAASAARPTSRSSSSSSSSRKGSGNGGSDRHNARSRSARHNARSRSKTPAKAAAGRKRSGSKSK
ncbi:MAG TPA: SRPBCC family protein [Thermoleophilaceae bacterium]|nr:SRPBCC family protein [Thermoleophilaceae bacterium]